MMDPLVAQARGLWEDLARVPVTFAPPGGVYVVVSPRSGLCPVGWVGMVTLGGSAIVTAPSESAARIVRDALGRLPVEAVVDSALVREALPVARVLGPVALSYVSPAGFRPVEAGALTVEQVSAAHPDLRSLEQVAGHEDAGEADLDEITSPAFVVREHGQVVAAAGYRAWPRRTAHVGVLTASSARARTGAGDGLSGGRSCSRCRAAAAVARAASRLPACCGVTSAGVVY